MGEIEGAMLRSGFGGWMRLVLKIKGRSKTVHNPLVGGRKRGLDKVRASFLLHKEHVPPSVDEVGNMYALPSLIWKNKKGQTLTELISDGDSPEKVAKRARCIWNRYGASEVGFSAHADFVNSIGSALLEMGSKIGTPTIEPGGVKEVSGKVDIQMGPRWKRACANFLLKALVFSGTQPSALRPLIAYAKGRNRNRIVHSQVHLEVSGKTIHGTRPRGEFGHYLEWKSSPDSPTQINAVVCLFTNKTDLGLVTSFSFPASRGILIPGNGRLIATYTEKAVPHGGWSELCLNETVVSSGRSLQSVVNMPDHWPGSQDPTPALEETLKKLGRKRLHLPALSAIGFLYPRIVQRR